MIDSTYLVASNPNTMRDQGPCRNAEYYFVPCSELDDMAAMRNTYQTSSTQSPVGKTFSKNKDGYSFGGKTKYGNLNHHQSAYKGLADSSPGYYMTNNKWSKSTDESTQKIYREYSQKVNDYTKNISQGIFSPGLVPSSKVNRLAGTTGKYNRRLAEQRRSIANNKNYDSEYQKYDPQRPNAFALKTGNQRITSKPSSAGRSYRSAKSLSKMIQREKRKREELEKRSTSSQRNIVKLRCQHS